jgi:hypothetical protein
VPFDLKSLYSVASIRSVLRSCRSTATSPFSFFGISPSNPTKRKVSKNRNRWIKGDDIAQENSPSIRFQCRSTVNAVKLPCSVVLVMADVMYPFSKVNYILACEDKNVGWISKRPSHLFLLQSGTLSDLPRLCFRTRTSAFEKELGPPLDFG